MFYFHLSKIAYKNWKKVAYIGIGALFCTFSLWSAKIQFVNFRTINTGHQTYMEGFFEVLDYCNANPTNKYIDDTTPWILAKDEKLKDIEAIHSRAEDLAKKEDYREKFDYVVTRAVSNLSTISEYMLPFLKIDGKAICMKGPNFEEELENAKKAINVLGGTIEKIENIKKVSKEDIIKLSKKVTPHTVYLLEGNSKEDSSEKN